MAGSGTRNARAISSVRKPPSARSVRVHLHMSIQQRRSFSRWHEGALLRPVETNQPDRRMAAHDPLAEGLMELRAFRALAEAGACGVPEVCLPCGLQRC